MHLGNSSGCFPDFKAIMDVGLNLSILFSIFSNYLANICITQRISFIVAVGSVLIKRFQLPLVTVLFPPSFT